MALLFSTLSAVTELVVTWAVLTTIREAYRGRSLLRARLVFALTYETLFNITYMTIQLTTEFFATGAEYPGWFIGIVAFHGVLSLVMFLGLVALFAVTWRAWGRGVNFLGEQPGFTRFFVVAWIVSVGTGEIVYLLAHVVGVGH